MPKNPFEVVVIIEAIIIVESFKAVGENSENTPIRHIKKNNTYGTNLKSIEGTLKKYL